MLTKQELLELRAEKEKAMKNIVETRGDNMDAEALATIKSFKEEIKDIDLKVEAIDELRSVAIKSAKPAEKTAEDSQKELRGLFESFLRKQISTQEYEKRAGTITANGDLVPEDFLKQLHETINEYGTIYPKVRKIITGENGELSIPTINDTANQGAWLGELDSIAKADFSTGTIKLNAYKLASGIEVSTELLEDSFFDISSYIAKALGERIARTVENSLIFGDGTSKPEGICMNANTVNATTAATGAVTSDDLIKMIHSIPPTQRQGAEFLVSDDVMATLLMEKDANGRPIMQPEAQSTVADGILYRLAGYPVTANYELQDITAGNKVAIFGKLQNYAVRTLRNISVKRDDYTGMQTDSVSFYATMRLDGKVVSANTCFVDLEVTA